MEIDPGVVREQAKRTRVPNQEVFHTGYVSQSILSSAPIANRFTASLLSVCRIRPLTNSEHI